ncbi:CocE/NonD family hydrolase [Stenotrophomonas sp. MMGLT7]|uniref:CocE/NonD family hydrolase n=1 Tax=Stenotrophomonas sp. MMGLT7 TaxID=2901227 RepID=UPI001E48B2FC|nr:CocE/NonD family hydrolase [Stenotrophomonas sp. MMGLT7]MCD7097313.1 CocE/NonD family hydrolase [Stenotrophomonas sp. MMGLT7]
MRLPCLCLALLLSLAFADAGAQTAPTTPDISGKPFVAPEQDFDYDKREVMIPMRDGVKLYTVVVVPKGARRAPILLTRTPYDAAGNASRNYSGKRSAILPVGDEVFVEDGYIRVYQDVRGKHGSEGEYVMNRPLRGPLNDTEVDHSTDAWDTIDWLVKHVPESNGKVGMIGSSYPGFTVVMALVNPHPALKAAAPQSPMIDGWMGDDWFSYGAFRQTMLDYFVGQTSKRGRGGKVAHGGLDDYANFLRAGSAGGFARQAGLEQLPFWHKVSEHPAYDAFWQGQALDRIMAAQPLKVPTMWIQGLWDQEDMWGAIHTYAAMEPKDRGNDRNFLVMGPWRHSQVNYDGSRLGALAWDGDTAYKFRRDVLKPFFDQYLKDGAPRADTPPVLIYNTALDRWDRYQAWPQSCEKGCSAKARPLYLAPGSGLSFAAPGGQGSSPYEEYVSDPAKPVPYRPRPIDPADRAGWQAWLVGDQRFVDGRPDVLTFVSEPLTEPLRVAGIPQANLFASTSGSDSDWVVKLIDVYPDEYPARPEMGGYQLPLSLTMFRGRYRESFEHPKAIAADKPLPYRFGMPAVNHVFLPGHRIMVQVQSTLFPLYDRNPQTFVPNIFFARPEDYRKATQRIWHAPQAASYIELPVM